MEREIVEFRLIKTRFTDLFGCSVPLQQAAMGGLDNPRLAAAVANAGALGMVAIGGLSIERVSKILNELKSSTSGALGVNITGPFEEVDNMSELAEVGAKATKVVEFFYGWPDKSLVDTVHSQGSLACWQLGSREEAIAAEKAGCDLIVAQGIEAGGHIRGKVGLMALLDEVIESVKIPVVAAGGIGSGRAMAAALTAGASAVRVGTRFVAADESGAHPDYVKALIRARAIDTVVTEKFSRDWPDAPHRVLRSSVEAADKFQGDIVAEGTRRDTGAKFPVLRFSTTTASIRISGDIAAMALYAGESVGGVRKVQPAAEIVRELASEAEDYLSKRTE